MKKIIVAIDGYSSSGKSTMAKSLARAVGYRYIDTGAMYRAVTLHAMRNDLISPDGEVNRPLLLEALPDIHISFSVDPASGASETILNGENVEREIRTLAVSNLVSPISAVPEVRSLLVRQQQAMGAEKGIVMDGRDIGTTVFPQAEMKVFVDASPVKRAQRRFLELAEKGQQPVYGEVLANIMERDRIDSTREVSPLRKADDALLLCNDEMTREQQMQWLLDQFNRITGADGQD